MDHNIPQSFTALLDEDDSPQTGGNSVSQVTPTNPYTSYPPYRPPNFHRQPHQQYYPPQPCLRNSSGGSSQHPRQYPPPYHPAPYNDQFQNVTNNEYPYYPPCYPPPPPNPNYYSGGSNSTTSSTPTGSMVGLGNAATDINPSTDEGDVEEVVGGAVIGAKKWIVEEDKRLIRAWINIGTDAVVGADQKKYGFWARVASNFNDHRPPGASTRTWKTINGRWSRCSPLVSKWAGIMLEVERTNQSGWNETMMLAEAHRLYTSRTGKRFDLDHWYEMLKDQPKWTTTCPLPHSGSGSSKRSNPDTEEAGDEVVGGNERPEGRKAAKRRAKHTANKAVVDLVKTQLKELSSNSTGMSDLFKDYITLAKEEKTLKMLVMEDKLRTQEDRVMMLDTSMMSLEQAAYYEHRKIQIMERRSRQSSSSQ